MEEQNQNLEEQNQNPGCLVYAAKICIVIIIIGLLCFFIDYELGASLVVIAGIFMAILYFLRLLF